MDSRGIRMLVSFNEQAMASGFPFTVSCGDSIGRLIAMTGLDRQLSVVRLPGD
jgi:anti-anti-sigma regulatory factor